MWGYHAAIVLLNIIYWCCYGKVDCGSVVKLSSVLFVLSEIHPFLCRTDEQHLLSESENIIDNSVVCFIS